MNLNTRLKKLRHEKTQLLERLRQEEAKASTRQRKRETRARIILGAAALSMPKSEREVILSMLLPLATERDREFIAEHLADPLPDEPTPPAAQN